MNCHHLDRRGHTWVYSARGEFPDHMNGNWLRRLTIFNREDIVRGHKWAMTFTYGILQFNIEVDQDSVMSMLMCVYGSPIDVTLLDRGSLVAQLDMMHQHPFTAVPFGLYPNPNLRDYPDFDTWVLEFMS